MAKELKIWNGRGHGVKFGAYHFYVAAYSVAQAVRIINRGASCYITASEINVYYSKGCWGNSMDGIIPDRPCLWANIGNSKPVLLYEEKEFKASFKGGAPETIIIALIGFLTPILFTLGVWLIKMYVHLNSQNI